MSLRIVGVHIVVGLDVAEEEIGVIRDGIV
jgi:hypothetical protein